MGEIGHPKYLFLLLWDPGDKGTRAFQHWMQAGIHSIVFEAELVGNE